MPRIDGTKKVAIVDVSFTSTVAFPQYEASVIERPSPDWPFSGVDQRRFVFIDLSHVRVSSWQPNAIEQSYSFQFRGQIYLGRSSKWLSANVCEPAG